MDEEEAKRYIKSKLEDYLIRKGINTRELFRCLNPMHPDKNPSMSYDRSRQKIHCFSCPTDWDIFDLIKVEYGLMNYSEAFSLACEVFNVDVKQKYDESKIKKGFPFRGKNQNQVKSKQDVQAVETFNESSYKPDFTEVIEKAHKELLNNSDALYHFQSRGLSREIIEKYKLGYASEGYNFLLKAFPQHKSESKKSNLYKYVFPYPDEMGKVYYFMTEIADRRQIDKYNGKYKKPFKGREGGSQLTAQLFNEKYLRSAADSNVVFICEGVYDALSIESVGGKAIALTGLGQTRLLNMIKKYRPQSCFILFLDNDNAGRAARKKLEDEFKKLNVNYLVKAPEGKDANEDLQENKEVFEAYIQKIIAETELKLQKTMERKNQKRQAYLMGAVSFSLQDFVDDIEKSKQAISTGLASVDGLLDGGLYSGLYCIGAISSLGKTSFCLQIADNIAKSGRDVIIFSLEMAKNELIAKSVSRLTYIQALQKYQTSGFAKTTRGILTGARYSGYNEKEKELIKSAIAEYSHYANHIFIHEGVGDIGVKNIREKVSEHVEITGKSPIVIVDYIQILAPYNDRYTDKQNTDRAVIELKRMSRDYDTAVIGISSFNRENYTAPVNMASFKESGAIEFSSDVLIGLQYGGMDWEDNESEKDRNKRVRKLFKDQIDLGRKGEAQKIQVKVLKNRNGRKGDTCMEFFPMFNYFRDGNSESWVEME